MRSIKNPDDWNAALKVSYRIYLLTNTQNNIIFTLFDYHDTSIIMILIYNHNAHVDRTSFVLIQEARLNRKIVVCHFYAAWAPTCKMAGRIFQRMSIGTITHKSVK